MEQQSILKKGFATRLRTFRNVNKMTQEEFGKKLGTTQGYICHLENNRRVPGGHFVLAFYSEYGPEDFEYVFWGIS